MFKTRLTTSCMIPAFIFLLLSLVCAGPAAFGKDKTVALPKRIRDLKMALPRKHGGAEPEKLTRPFEAGQCNYADGIAVSGESTLTFVIPEGIKRFEAMAGLMPKNKQQRTNKSGIVFSATIDGKEVYNSGNIEFLPWNRPSRLWIPVKPGQTLELSAGSWGPAFKGWKAAWTEPRMIPSDTPDWDVPPGAPADSIAPTPPMAWNSWYVYRFGVNEAKMKKAADLMVSKGLKDAGYIYCNLDDGWSYKPWHDKQGNPLVDKKKFPNGLKAVGDYIHSKSLKFGMYARHDRMGKGNETVNARLIAEAGADFLKYDFVKPAPKRLTLQMADAIRATERPITFLACVWGLENPWEWGPEENIQLWRSGYDIETHWNKNSENFMGILNAADRNEPLARYARPGHWNDPDMLVLGGKVGTMEFRSQFGLWCIMAAPLFIGINLEHTPAEIMDILKNSEAIAIDQDTLGIQGWRVQKMDEKEVWMKPLSSGDLAVGLLNRGGQPVEITALWSHLCVDGKQRVRDVWAKKDDGVAEGAITRKVPKHGLALLRLSPVK